ncbi:CtsR family transcriptional regulator [Nicoliella spurrieriana]|uniref:Transcriptional regulator CtsR n=1 Tax=Nicoliella spurrieriana TaxID=2925830 RepID=A0A976X4U5_9LACO|nr:CtsR family transcriptional regulator [Nicoliella spurrieriana]UQS86338.1 CtsR family transcriptional regulator [Nicoliella spurrieriana]
MQSKNVSDIIEKYLKQILAETSQIEIRRSEVAELFHVVPSQINYVIKTRFTIQNGYVVESKRGGGGYIRIEKVKLLDNIEVLDSLLAIIGSSISERDGGSIVKTLYHSQLLSSKEARIILAAIDKDSLMINNDTMMANRLRAQILSSVLNHLRFED